MIKRNSSTLEASATFLQLRAILARYASTITVDGILTSACTRTRLVPSRVDRDNLERIIQEVRIGIRIFCDSDRIPSILHELTTLARSPDVVD